MKTKSFFSFAIVLAIFSLLLISCEKQEEVSNINAVAIKAQLSKIPIPKEEIKEFLALGKSGAQKAPADESQSIVLVEIFPLDSTTYQITGDDLAMRYFWYSEIDQNGLLKKSLTVRQVFNVIDGKINETDYSFNVQIGCPFARYFNFENNGSIDRITYFFRFNNGNQFAYFSNNANRQVSLPPIAEGKWQLKVDFYDAGIFQSFMSEFIDYYGSDIIRLKFGVKEENVLSIVFLDKSYIQNAYMIQFIGKDEDDNYIAVSYPTSYDENLPDRISFNTPIRKLNRIIICSTEWGCIYYGLRVSSNSPVGENKIYYDLIPQ